ncbi:MAG TPA: hypothetical protein VLD67_08260 [Vicinamibacterales bacterium]|nr:hypothetical protein [Vicinamibacterales bacterium]
MTASKGTMIARSTAAGKSRSRDSLFAVRASHFGERAAGVVVLARALFREGLQFGVSAPGHWELGIGNWALIRINTQSPTPNFQGIHAGPFGSWELAVGS